MTAPTRCPPTVRYASSLLYISGPAPSSPSSNGAAKPGTHLHTGPRPLPAAARPGALCKNPCCSVRAARMRHLPAPPVVFAYKSRPRPLAPPPGPHGGWAAVRGGVCAAPRDNPTATGPHPAGPRSPRAPLAMGPSGLPRSLAVADPP